VQQELQKAYGSVVNIDPFEGGLAEDHVAGSDMGPLFTRIIADQFNRLRAGDRFFYLNESWTPDELRLVRQGNTLAKIIEANTNVKNLQSDVFVFNASISGNVLSHSQKTDGRGVSGITVQLEDDNGNVLATTVTDSKGHYLFNQLNGVSATGDYTVRLVVPSGFTQASTNPSPILISRGGANVTGVNFDVEPTSSNALTQSSQTTTQSSTSTSDQSLDVSAVDALFSVFGRQT